MDKHIEPVLSENIEAIAKHSPYFFTASTQKLVLMSICTFGMYEFYWFYKNWVLIKARTGEGLMPFWRAFFSPIWAYSCFREIQDAAVSNNTRVPESIGLLAIAYFILQALYRLPDPFWLVSVLSFTPIISINAAALEVNRRVATIDSGYENAKFSVWNKAGLILGGLSLVLIAIGLLFFPESK